MPVAPVAGQARRLDREDGADFAPADRRQKPVEAGTRHATTRAAKVVVNDRYILPSERPRSFTQPILAPLAFPVVLNLCHCRLPYIYIGRSIQMMGVYLAHHSTSSIRPRIAGASLGAATRSESKA